jgi:hypothetical protein
MNDQEKKIKKGKKIKKERHKQVEGFEENGKNIGKYRKNRGKTMQNIIKKTISNLGI